MRQRRHELDWRIVEGEGHGNQERHAEPQQAGTGVHRRDGTVTLLDESQIAPFLHTLDETGAAQIRFVEIERAGEVIKNASIVDTPGLNALDAYHEEVAREFIDEADAIVWVFSATRGGAA